MNDRSDEPEDTRYPAIKIFALASLLADVTTDYARPFLLGNGMSLSQIQVLNTTVRPVIDLYEGDFYGIVPDELRRLQRNIKDRLIEEKESPEAVFRLLLRLSSGRRRFLRVPRLAQLDLDPYIREIRSKPKTFKAFEKLYQNIITSPRKSLRQKYANAQSAWEQGKRTSWDDAVNGYIFANLGVEPDVTTPAANLSWRELAEAVITRFDESERRDLHHEILAVLARPEAERIGYSELHQVPSFDEIAKRSAEEWAELRVDLANGFVDQTRQRKSKHSS